VARWHDLGPLEDFTRPVTPVAAGKTRLAVTRVGDRLCVVSGACNHVGGPLGEGSLEGEYLVCPWHAWKYHACTGKGEPGYEEDAVPAYASRVEGGRLLV
jgi:nitrite reductase/ring-hydroxylating ferredoxin subunit